MPLADESHDPDQYEKLFWEPIGKFVFRFGYVERDIDWALSALLKLEYFRQGEVVFSQISSLPSKLKLLNTLTRQRTNNKSHRDAIEKIVAELDDHRFFRNALVHGPWGGYTMTVGADPVSGSWQKAYVSNRLKTAVVEITLADLKNRHQRLSYLRADLVNTIQAIMKAHHIVYEPPPSPDRPPAPIDPQS